MTKLFEMNPRCIALGLAAMTAAGCFGRSAVDLRTDNRVNPLGIDRLPPALSWRMDAGGRQGAAQSAYRVVSASSAPALRAGKFAWDSGRVDSDISTQVLYAGPAPKPTQRVWWQVKIWDEAGTAGDWSEPAWFETGLLDDQNWGDAEWIGDTRDYRAPEPAPVELMGPWTGRADGAPMARLTLDLKLPNKPIVSAHIHNYFPEGKSVPRKVLVNMAGRSRLYESFLKRAGGRGMGPLEVSTELRPGQMNRIEIEFVRPAEATSFGMLIVYADGSEQLVQSSPDWKTFFNNQETGEARVLDNYGGSQYGVANSHPQSSYGPSWFRQRVPVKKDLARARLYLCALGQGLAYLNGRIVDDVFFSSPQSDYEEFAYYTAHDITSMLKRGDNALSILLDSSWYHQVGGFGRIFSYGHPGLKAKVLLEYVDGSTETVVSDGSWQWRESEILLANIYRGERIDYRLQHNSWKNLKEQDGWKAVDALSPLSPKLVAMDVTPVTRDGELSVVKRWQIGAKTWLFDFGQTTHGTVRLKFHEPEGAVIRLRYSEYAENGIMENVPLSHWLCHGVMQYDEIISDGKPKVFESAFTTKSFRFVEVSGLSKAPVEGDVVAFPVHTEAEVLATFESSDPMLNRLFGNGMRTFENYISHMSADIPRERCLWGLESIYSFQTAAYCYDWQNNHRLMNTLWWTGRKAPHDIPGLIGVGLRLSTTTDSFNWSATPLLLTSRLLEFFDDSEPTHRYYQQAKDFLSFYEKNCDEKFIPIHNVLADHAPPQGVQRQQRDPGVIARMTFFESQRRFAAMAATLGETKDAAHARRFAEKILAAIMEDYDAQNHTFGNATYDSLALAYQVITKPEERKAVAKSIAAEYRGNGHQFNGGFMSYEIYSMLAEYGFVDDAYEMLVNTDYPGPAQSIKGYDATTFFERYCKSRVEQMKVGQNFWAFGHSTGWMVKYLAGLGYDPDKPMGRGMILAPKVPRPGKLNQVTASLKTPTGLCKSDWTYVDGVFDWRFTIPANSSAEVHIPTDDAASIQGAAGMEKLRSEEGVAIYHAVAGTYTVQSRLREQKPVVSAAPAISGSSKEWRLSEGCAASVADGVMTVTRSPSSPTQMLTTRLPAFSGEDAKLVFRMKTPASGKAMVRVVSRNEGSKSAQNVEFNLNAPGEWCTYSIPLPAFEGTPASLWVGLVSAKEELQFSEIRLESNGVPLKMWNF